jgi:Na+/H+ antiporter NhaC
MKFRKLINDSVTESDGESFDPIAILSIVTTLFVLVVMGHNYFVRGNDFNIMDFGIGIAAIWAGSAGGSRLRPQTHRPLASRRTEDLE